MENPQFSIIIPKMSSTAISPRRKEIILALTFVFLLSFFTYFFRYWQPQAVFWDENYHIASAQKYINSVFFMEQHPPLGKMLIAMGEQLLDANDVDDAYIGTDYATDFPPEFSFAGYRFFPALLGWLTAPLLFLIFLSVTRNTLLSIFGSFLYIFDNALIVHLRGAMLEGPFIFFSALLILAFLLLYHSPPTSRRLPILTAFFGASFAFLMTTKVLGLLFILLIPVLLIRLRKTPNVLLPFIFTLIVSFVIPYATIWQIHFASGDRIVETLPDGGYYQASETYKNILSLGLHESLSAFPVMIRDSWNFIGHYNSGTPRLDLCKADENGSPYFLWPIGARTINYRWETPDGTAYRYLYLVANPVVWWLSLTGVIVAVSLLISSVLVPAKKHLRDPLLLVTFLGLYISYMIAISQIDRVMYLYHYFLPLLLGFIILMLVLMEVQYIGRLRVSEQWRVTVAIICAILIFVSFLFFSPLTYYQPLTDKQFQRRAWIDLWGLHCVHCERPNPLAVACSAPA